MNYCNTSLSSLCAVNWRLNILTPSQTPHDHLSFYLVWRTLYGWRKTRRHPSPLLYQLLSLIGWITDPYEIEIQKLDNGKKKELWNIWAAAYVFIEVRHLYTECIYHWITLPHSITKLWYTPFKIIEILSMMSSSFNERWR